MVLAKTSWCRILATAFLFVHPQTLIRSVSSLSVLPNKKTGEIYNLREESVNASPTSHQQQGDHRIDCNHLVAPAASTQIHLAYSSGRRTTTEAYPGPRQSVVHLFLKRHDGIELYGRDIVHAPEDAKTATLAILSDDRHDVSRNESFLWDATLVLRPEDTGARENDERRAPPLFLVPPEQSSPTKEETPDHRTCFVAMNRFQVKVDCRALFEERWSQRKSKLPFQPGFVGFSLLRRTTTTTPATKNRNQPKNSADACHSYCDRFNYSTCTIWDSFDSWSKWRNGTGKSSHDASRETSARERRVPVSEWLEGPSSPIFWDGSTSNNAAPPPPATTNSTAFSDSVKVK